MPPSPTVDEIIRLARQLCPLDKLKVIQLLAPDLEPALADQSGPSLGNSANLDDQYQRGYERSPEDVADVKALLPHLSIPPEKWE